MIIYPPVATIGSNNNTCLLFISGILEKYNLGSFSSVCSYLWISIYPRPEEGRRFNSSLRKAFPARKIETVRISFLFNMEKVPSNYPVGASLIIY